jgi:NAD(P)-dependent dehydrogenase (short-subunit alcohol dehydrogenase family)
MSKEDRKTAGEEASMKRLGTPKEVAKVAASLASCNFSFTKGNTIVIDCGTVYCSGTGGGLIGIS